jgi:Trp operon repressor
MSSFLELMRQIWEIEQPSLLDISVWVSFKMSKRKRNDLTLADCYEVVKLLNQKLTQTEISKRLGCSISQICRINSKKDDNK